MADHPKRSGTNMYGRTELKAWSGYAAVRGADPIAKGPPEGRCVGLCQGDPATGCIQQIVVATIDGKTLLPDVWYGANLEKDGELI